MKRSNYILIAALCAIDAAAYAQTVPFVFKNSKSKMFKGLPDGVIYEDFKKDDGTIGQKKVKVKTDYSTISKSLEETAENLQIKANQEFSDGITSLGTPTNVGELRAYEINLETLEAKRKLALKDAEYFKKRSAAYKYLARTSGTFTIFPVKTAVDAEMYYNGFVKDTRAKFLSNTLLSFSSDGGKASLFNEIYVDYFGPIRVGLGAMISNKQRSEGQETVENKEETNQDAMQRLLGGGGNGVLSLSYPLFNVDNGEGFAIKFGVAPKLSVDIPKIGTENKDYGLNYNIGAEGTIFYTGENNVITFFSNFRFARIDGNNVFYSNLEKVDKKSFGFNQISFGLAFSSTFRLSYNYYFGSEFVNKNFPGAISFSIIPN